MKLTAIQREFLTVTLGVKPSGKKFFQRRTTEEKKDETTTAAFDEYQSREQKVMESVRELEAVPGTAELVAEFERELGAIQQKVKGATRDDADAIFKKAYKDLEAIKSRAQAEASKHTKN